MNVDGSQRRQLASAPIIYDFAVTPDSKSIVYAAGSALLRVAIDGGAATTIATAGVFVKSLQIAPDGGAVIFSALEQTSIKLFKVSLAGGPVTKLLPDRASDGVVSPNGRLLACTYGMAEPVASLAILPMAGGKPNVLALKGRLYRWSPDGKSIVFIKDDGTKENLYVLPIGAKEATPITKFTDGSIENFSWSPDGTRILLTHSLQTRDVVLLR
jgi:Tol biopolymer transport system component